MFELSDLDKKLLNNYQKEFPLTPSPFADLGRQLGTDEETVINRLKVLTEEGYISRIGPVFKVNGIGVSILAALCVPEEKLIEVAELISKFDEVNHNYEREHKFNLWFVITGRSHDQISNTVDNIEKETGLSVLRLPMLEDYHIDLGFDLEWN